MSNNPGAAKDRAEGVGDAPEVPIAASGRPFAKSTTKRSSPRTDGEPKRLSGFARRKVVKERLERRLTSEVRDPRAYEKLGEPPVDDPATGLEYVRKVQLIALSEIARAKLGQLEKWRLIKDMGATIGMTHNRAALETRLASLERKLRDKRQLGGAMRVEVGTSVKRPSTARGASDTTTSQTEQEGDGEV